MFLARISFLLGILCVYDSATISVCPFSMRSQSKSKASNTHVFQTIKELSWVEFELTLKSRHNCLPAELPGQLSRQGLKSTTPLKVS